MQDQALLQAASPMMSLPYHMAMESCRSFCLPQAASAPHYLAPFISNEEEGSCHSYAPLILQEERGGEELPCSYLHDFEPILTCMQSTPPLLPSLPLWETPQPSFPSPQPFLFEQGLTSSLLSLQALLKTQYGISLTLEQLLELDVLPALLQAEADPPHELINKLEQSPLDHSEACFGHVTCQNMHSDHDNLPIYHDNPAINHDILPINHGFNACLSPLLYVNDPFRSQDVSSPGTATSSASVLTDSENNDQSFSAECIAPTIPTSISPPLASIYTSPSWISPSISWLAGVEDRGPCSAMQEDMELAEPPAQRPNFQGITLEQVMEAEIKQQMNAVATGKSSASQAAKSNPFMGRDVLQGIGNGDRGRSYGNTAEGMTPMPHRRKPVALMSVEPQSVAARQRRERIREKTKSLELMIPGASRLDTAAMFDLAIKYVHFLQAQMCCLEKEASASSHRRASYEGGDDESDASFRRALRHRLLASQEVQHFLSREGLCLVTESLARSLNFDPTSLLPP